MRILIIEDQIALADLWKRYLKKAFDAAQVDIATTVKEALALLREPPPPEIAFVDLNLPDSTDREQTLRFLLPRIGEMSPDTLVIVATGMAWPKLLEIAKALGADSFHDKYDIDSQENLLGAVRSCITRSIRAGKPSLQVRMEMIERLDRMLPADKEIPGLL